MPRGTRISIWCMSWLMAFAIGAAPAGAREGCYPPPCATPAATVVGPSVSPDLPSMQVPAEDAGGASALPVVALAFVMLAGTLTVLCAGRRSEALARTTVPLSPAAVRLRPARERAEPERSLH